MKFALGLGINARAENLETMGAFDIGNLDDLVTWFKFNTNISTADRDSDGDNDITWTSSHTDARTASQTTDLQEPTTTSGYIDFDGSEDNLDLSSQLTLTQFTMFLAIDFGSLSNETVLGKTNDADMFLRFGYQTNAAKFRFRRGDAATNNVDGVMDESLTTGEINLITIRCFQTAGGSDTTLKIELSKISGGEVTTNEIYSEDDSTFDHGDNLALNTIGVQTTNSAAADMKLYEWVVFDANLTSATRRNIQIDILNRTS
tara:strand:+ start:4662 stop:5441 length:780 start_codon:yes stop_codon:yes gene_type:complete